MGSIVSVADFCDMLRRRRMTILGVFILGSVITLLFVAAQRELYVSSEVLQIQNATISGDLAPPTVSGSSARRLQLIEQQVMSRGAILELIATLGLFADQPAMNEARQVAAIRRAVSISGVAAARDGYRDDGSLSLLRITAEWPTAEGARRLAHEVSMRTVSLSVSSRLDQSRDTLDFFAAQEDTLNSEIIALEREIAQFRTANTTALPAAVDDAQREIALLNQQIAGVDRQMIALQRRIAAPTQRRAEPRQIEDPETRLADLAGERALLVQMVAKLEEGLTGTPQTRQRLDDYARQLQDLRAEASAASARRKEAEIAYRLETQRQSERLTLLETAVAADEPFTRSRELLFVLGAAVSLLAGVVVAFLVDLRYPVIRTAAQMERQLGLRPVVSIPQMIPQAEPRTGLRPRLKALIAGTGR